MLNFSKVKALTPKELLLIDGIGALVSAAFLGLILPSLSPYIGLPDEVLYFLALLPVLFAIFDFGCYFFKSSGFKNALKIMVVANALYCVLSIICLGYHFDALGNLGWVYFILEILILLVLIKVEWEVVVKDKAV